MPKSCLALAGALSAGLALCLLAGPAAAHGALKVNREVCFLFVGPDYMFFTGYDPANPMKRYCEDVPHVGYTVITLDIAHPYMREMKIELRIMRDIGETDDQSAVEHATLAYRPPQLYPAGDISVPITFSEGGMYVGIVTLDGPHGEHWTARFPFSVGRPLFTTNLPIYLLTAAALGAVGMYFWGYELLGRKSWRRS